MLARAAGLFLFLFQNNEYGDCIMKNARKSISLTTMLLTLALCAPSFAQDNTTPKTQEKPSGGPDAQMMATMMEMAKPGENHKVLEREVGSWTYKVKWWMSPDAPPMESTGTRSTKSVMDGRYIISEHTGKMSMPGPDGKIMDSEFKAAPTKLDWPQFLGPRANGISDETGLLDKWPANGPPLVWEKGVGTGYGAPSVLGKDSCSTIASAMKRWWNVLPPIPGNRSGVSVTQAISLILTVTTTARAARPCSLPIFVIPLARKEN
jgi:hypothetical protein